MLDSESLRRFLRKQDKNSKLIPGLMRQQMTPKKKCLEDHFQVT